jgi:hypothetical protein
MKYNKTEFLEICRKSGYATDDIAKRYAKNRNEFTVDSFIEVSELSQYFNTPRLYKTAKREE